MPNGERYTIRTKFELMKKCQFSITAESVCYPGFTSEKLVEGFRSKTIPIYYGDPTVNKDFNLNAFVDCYQYPTIDDAVERIIEIDKNDELYIHMFIF